MALYIGLMSGTSLDGVDAVLVDISAHQFNTLACESMRYPDELCQTLHQLCNASEGDIELMMQTDQAVAQIFAECANRLIEKQSIDLSQIVAIGSHGQTIRHRPPVVIGEVGTSLQIGDPNTIAAITGVDVVADFRRKDLALGGQGAPLVPKFHQHVFACANQPRIVVNIGGIANLSLLPNNKHDIKGYDSGPGNTLMDLWCLKHKAEPFDRDGEWGRSGKLHNELLRNMLQTEYLRAPAPKSTGRELFNLNWLEQHLVQFDAMAAEDVQCTLTEFTAKTIADEVTKNGYTHAEVYLCGGGAFNGFLLERIGCHLPHAKLATTAALGLHPQWVEGAAFAWLAHAFTHRIPGNAPSVTGAQREAVLGALYPA